jgi:cell fate regulator YaaT (PSP1 superfamily)
MPKYIIRYGAMRILGIFDPPGEQALSRWTAVIVRTDRGLEAGEVLCEATPAAVGGLTDPPQGQVLRRMTPEDAHELRRLHEQEREEFKVCQRCIEQSGLEMELVDVEHLFGGERIVVYYLAEGRVDFRELVRTLAAEFQTRIEMRQIGVRDEAKLMADFGDCGKEVCCNSHLVAMPPVSMKMAKLQKATLDPTKISGRCGRLKCCLRYEYDVYEQLQRELPPIGSRVATGDGRVRIVGHEILSSQLLVETEARVRKYIHVSEVLSGGEGNGNGGGQGGAEQGSETSPSGA